MDEPPDLFKVREAVFVYRQWLFLVLIVIAVTWVGGQEDVREVYGSNQ